MLPAVCRTRAVSASNQVIVSIPARQHGRAAHLSCCLHLPSQSCSLSHVLRLHHLLLMLPHTLLAAELVLALDAALQVLQQPHVVLALVVALLPAGGRCNVESFVLCRMQCVMQGQGQGEGEGEGEVPEAFDVCICSGGIDVR